MTEQSKDKYEKVNQLMASGVGLREACAQVGMGNQTYYNIKNKLKATIPTVRKPRKYNKRQSKLIIHELPQQASAQSGSGFLVVGSPRQLAEFARAYS